MPSLARGCAVLGAGGGGTVSTAIPSAINALRDAGHVDVVRLADLDDDALVAVMSAVGAPTVGHEMLPSALQPLRLRDEIEALFGRRLDAVMAAEIGGSNGVAPVAWAAQMGLPLLDADGMGRAFPESQMIAMNVAGRSPSPVVMADVVGNVSILKSVDAEWAERQSRALCVASGGSTMVADWTLTAAEARGAVIEGSVSAAARIGRAVEGSLNAVQALREELDAVLLLEGKVIDVEHTTGGGFVRGSVTVEGAGDFRDRLLRIELQNENLVAIEDGALVASVPDLIAIVDSHTATAISTEVVRYGQRVSVLAWPCDRLWRTPRGLDIAGPRAFGYDIAYRPVEELADGR